MEFTDTLKSGNKDTELVYIYTIKGIPIIYDLDFVIPIYSHDLWSKGVMADAINHKRATTIYLY